MTRPALPVVVHPLPHPLPHPQRHLLGLPHLLLHQ